MGKRTFDVFVKKELSISLPIDFRLVRRSEEVNKDIEQDERFLGCVEAKSYEDAVEKLLDKLSRNLSD